MKDWIKNSLLVFPDVNSISITSRWMSLCKTKTSAKGIDNKMDMCSSGTWRKKEKFNLEAWDISKGPEAQEHETLPHTTKEGHLP